MDLYPCAEPDGPVQDPAGDFRPLFWIGYHKGHFNNLPFTPGCHHHLSGPQPGIEDGKKADAEFAYLFTKT